MVLNENERVEVFLKAGTIVTPDWVRIAAAGDAERVEEHSEVYPGVRRRDSRWIIINDGLELSRDQEWKLAFAVVEFTRNPFIEEQRSMLSKLGEGLVSLTKGLIGKINKSRGRVDSAAYQRLASVQH